MTAANADVPTKPDRRPLRDRLLARALARVLRRRPGGSPGAPGIDPGALPFDANFYLASNPDVAAAGMDPLQHFLQHGLGEDRDPHPLVDIRCIRSQLGGAVLDPKRLSEALADPSIQPHPLFDARAYLVANPDVAASGMAPLAHFIDHGAEEGRRPLPGFDPDWYLARHPEAGTNRYQAFVHFVRTGRDAGFPPGPDSAGPEMPTPARAARATAPAGVLDVVQDLVAHGWAFAPDAPPEGAPVEIHDGDRVVGRGRAAEYRRDLAGPYGDGHCGFSIPLSRTVADGRPHVLRARIAGSSGWLHGEIECTVPALDAPFDLLPASEAASHAKRIAAGLPSRERSGFVDAIASARLSLECGQYEAALGDLEQVSARFAGNALTDLSIAEAQLGMERADLALEPAHRATAEPGLAPWAWLAVGSASRMLGQWKEAGEAFRKADALARQPGFAAARLQQVEERAAAIEGRRLLAAGDHETALKVLLPVLLRRPASQQLQDLVLKAQGVAGEEGMRADGEVRRARRAIALLGCVVDHLQVREGA